MNYNSRIFSFGGVMLYINSKIYLFSLLEVRYRGSSSFYADIVCSRLDITEPILIKG